LFSLLTNLIVSNFILENFTFIFDISDLFLTRSIVERIGSLSKSSKESFKSFQ